MSKYANPVFAAQMGTGKRKFKIRKKKNKTSPPPMPKPSRKGTVDTPWGPRKTSRSGSELKAPNPKSSPKALGPQTPKQPRRPVTPQQPKPKSPVGSPLTQLVRDTKAPPGKSFHSASSNDAVSVPSKQPPQWEEYTSRSGRVYYYNPLTKESRWDRPAELPVPVVPEGQWLPATSKDGKTYYYNTVTLETRWVMPASAHTQDKNQIRSNATPNTTRSVVEQNVVPDAAKAVVEQLTGPQRTHVIILQAHVRGQRTRRATAPLFAAYRDLKRHLELATKAPDRVDAKNTRDMLDTLTQAGAPIHILNSISTRFARVVLNYEATNASKSLREREDTLSRALVNVREIVGAVTDGMDKNEVIAACVTLRDAYKNMRMSAQHATRRAAKESVSVNKVDKISKLARRVWAEMRRKDAGLVPSSRIPDATYCVEMAQLNKAIRAHDVTEANIHECVMPAQRLEHCRHPHEVITKIRRLLAHAAHSGFARAPVLSNAHRAIEILSAEAKRRVDAAEKEKELERQAAELAAEAAARQVAVQKLTHQRTQTRDVAALDSDGTTNEDTDDDEDEFPEPPPPPVTVSKFMPPEPRSVPISRKRVESKDSFEDPPPPPPPPVHTAASTAEHIPARSSIVSSPKQKYSDSLAPQNACALQTPGKTEIKKPRTKAAYDISRNTPAAGTSELTKSAPDTYVGVLSSLIRVRLNELQNLRVLAEMLRISYVGENPTSVARSGALSAEEAVERLLGQLTVHSKASDRVQNAATNGLQAISKRKIRSAMETARREEMERLEAEEREQSYEATTISNSRPRTLTVEITPEASGPQPDATAKPSAMLQHTRSREDTFDMALAGVSPGSQSQTNTESVPCRTHTDVKKTSVLSAAKSKTCVTKGEMSVSTSGKRTSQPDVTNAGIAKTVDELDEEEKIHMLFDHFDRDEDAYLNRHELMSLFAACQQDSGGDQFTGDDFETFCEAIGADARLGVSLEQLKTIYMMGDGDIHHDWELLGMREQWERENKTRSVMTNALLTMAPAPRERAAPSPTPSARTLLASPPPLPCELKVVAAAEPLSKRRTRRSVSSIAANVQKQEGGTKRNLIQNAGTEKIKEGWLWKRGVTNSALKKRFCRLLTHKGDCFLQYFKRADDEKAAGTITITHKSQVLLDPRKDRYFHIAPHGTVGLATAGKIRKFIFKCVSVVDRKAWVAHLRQLIGAVKASAASRRGLWDASNLQSMAAEFID